MHDISVDMSFATLKLSSQMTYQVCQRLVFTQSIGIE